MNPDCQSGTFLQTRKNPPKRAFLKQDQLLDLGFLVRHMLTYNRIEFIDYDLVGGSTLVLVGGIEVAGTGTGHQTDQFTHNELLKPLRRVHAAL